MLRGAAPLYAAQPHRRHFLTDARLASPWVLDALARQYAVVAIGPYWFIDTALPVAPIAGFALRPWRAAGGLPRDRVEPDPFSTWELRAHADQRPNPPPTTTPHTPEELRIAHNVAVAQGDAVGAARLREGLSRTLDGGPACVEPDGARLLGARLSHDAGAMLTVYFLAARPLTALARFGIEGTEIRAPRGSWVRADPQDRVVGTPFATPPMRWRPGFIYALAAEVLPRPGTERFVGRWTGRTPSSLGDCAPPRTLATLSEG